MTTRIKKAIIASTSLILIVGLCLAAVNRHFILYGTSHVSFQTPKVQGWQTTHVDSDMNYYYKTDSSVMNPIIIPSIVVSRNSTGIPINAIKFSLPTITIPTDMGQSMIFTPTKATGSIEITTSNDFEKLSPQGLLTLEQSASTSPIINGHFYAPIPASRICGNKEGEGYISYIFYFKRT